MIIYTYESQVCSIRQVEIEDINGRRSAAEEVPARRPPVGKRSVLLEKRLASGGKLRLVALQARDDPSPAARDVLAELLRVILAGGPELFHLLALLGHMVLAGLGQVSLMGLQA